jgi:hypothetical protein
MKHHIQEIQEIRPPASDRSSDWSIQPGHLSNLDIFIAEEERKRERKKPYNSIQCCISGKIVFIMLVPYREFISLVMTSILIVLWG